MLGAIAEIKLYIMIFGYIRVSTVDQNVDRQIDELKDECNELFIDRLSGRKAKRPELMRMMEKLREGDKIVIVRLSRFGRSVKDLISLSEQIQSAGATLESKKEGFKLDGSPMGKMLFGLLSVLAEFEVDMIRQRTMEGLAAARARGRVGGRPKGLDEAGQKTAKLVVKLYADPEWSIRQISDHLNIAVSTVYNYLKHEGVKVGRDYKKRAKTS